MINFERMTRDLKQLMEFKRFKESEQSTECLHTIVLSELKVIKSQYFEIKNENMELKEFMVAM